MDLFALLERTMLLPCRLPLFVVISFSFVSAPLFAQTETPYVTTPPLGQVLPIELKNGHVMSRLTFAVNWERIVPAGATLRCCYARPIGLEAARVDEARRGISELNEYQRQTRYTNAQIYREKAYWRKLATEDVWTNPDLFRTAAVTIDVRGLRLVYVDPDHTRRKTEENATYVRDDLPLGFNDEPWILPEGLFLADGEGGIQILAVENGTSAEKAGLKAGDLIRQTGGTPVVSLADWLQRYPGLKSVAKGSGKRTLLFVVRRGGEDVECAIPLPRLLQGGVLDLPVETTKPGPSSPSR